MRCAACGDPAPEYVQAICPNGARGSGVGCCKKCCVCDRALGRLTHWLSDMEQDENAYFWEREECDCADHESDDD